MTKPEWHYIAEGYQWELRETVVPWRRLAAIDGGFMEDGTPYYTAWIPCSEGWEQCSTLLAAKRAARRMVITQGKIVTQEVVV